MSIIDEFFFDKFLKRGLLKVMFDQLNVNSVVDYLEVLLEGIEYFLMYGAQVSGPDQINFIIPIIASYGYLQKIDELQFHVNKSVCNKVSLIVDKYFQNLD